MTKKKSSLAKFEFASVFHIVHAVNGYGVLENDGTTNLSTDEYTVSEGKITFNAGVLAAGSHTKTIMENFNKPISRKRYTRLPYNASRPQQVEEERPHLQLTANKRCLPEHRRSN
ncbi:hemoblobin-interacting domain-containing protein [Paenibacillus luteus]|uniref:hemoblobin-interacting domain-containing protein n=1 Tax=Paenibacillus luteus TaxID=2545753 RepID=UPI001144C3F6|nr:hypothetical protein [Paenibacillus luteus]